MTTKVQRLPRHKKNLCIVTDEQGNQYVKSYNTLVAKITPTALIQLGWWSVTTQRHISYAGRELNIPVVKD